MTMIRSRTDHTTKGLAAVGTAAVTAIGYAKLADVFPYHGPSWSIPVLVLGLSAMVVAVVRLVQRFERIGDTIITYADIQRTLDCNRLEEPERTTLEREYKNMAALNGVETLRAYNARAHRFERIADRADSGTASSLRARADAIRAEVLATQDRVVVFILRERAKTAFFSPRVVLWLVVFLLGWYSTALAADVLQAHRSESPEPSKGSTPTLTSAQPPQLSGRPQPGW